MTNTKISLHGLMMAAMLALPLAASFNTAAIAAEAPGGEKFPAADPAGARPDRDDGPDHGRDRSPFGGCRGVPMDSPFGAPPGGADDGAPPFLHRLDLSEAQQDKIFAILHGQQPARREQHKIVIKSREALRQMNESDTYDDAKAVALVQAETQAIGRITLQRMRSEQQILALLSAEQRKQMEEHRPRMGGRDDAIGGPDGDRRPPRPQ